jgi:hypothetical protein
LGVSRGVNPSLQVLAVGHIEIDRLFTTFTVNQHHRNAIPECHLANESPVEAPRGVFSLGGFRQVEELVLVRKPVVLTPKLFERQD